MSIWDLGMINYLAIGLLICTVGMFVIGATKMSIFHDDDGGLGFFSFIVVSIFAWPLLAIPLAVAALVAVLMGSYKLGQKLLRR